MSDFTIKEITGDDIEQYWNLACCSFHMVQHGFGTEEHKAKLRDNEEKKAREVSSLGGNRSVLTGFFKDDRLVAGMRIVARTSHFDGNRCEMGGVGGVLSDPEFRKTGGVSSLFRYHLKQMYEKGQILSHLYPFKTSFYRKYGYEHLTLFALWTIPAENMRREPYNGIVRYNGTIAAQKDVRDIFAAFASKYNLATEKTGLMWERYFKDKEPCSTPFYSYLHYTDGKPDGFFSYKRETGHAAPPVIKVMNLYFSNKEALRNMLNFLAAMGEYASTIAIRLPVDVDISMLLDEIAAVNGNRNVQREFVYKGASRVVDVEKILKLAKYNGRGTVSVKVSDPMCPWNDRCFRVAFDEHCICVEEGDAPDVEMTINAFSALILGAFSITDMVLPEGVKIYGNEENLKKVFYRKPCWVEDSF